MKFKKLGLVISAVAAASVANALDITIFDGENGSSFGSGLNPNNRFTAGQVEDQETEPSTTQNQGWDLEAFSKSGAASIGIVSGFDMRTGNVAPSFNTPMGDIFIRKGSPVDFINQGNDGTKDFAFDYVVHFNTSPWGTGVNGVQYTIYTAAQATTIVETGDPGTITGGGAHHNDHLYKAYSTTAGVGIAGLGDYVDNVSDALSNVGSGNYVGGNHDLLSSVDLSGLFAKGDTVYLYATMGCGNDVLQGKFTVPDGGATLAMLGGGLFGLAMIRRRLA